MNDRAARWRLGVILLFALALAWGISWPVMKIALAEIPPWTFRAMGGTGGAAGLLFLSLLSKQPLRIARNHLPALFAVALLNFTVWQICVAYGLTMMGAGHAVVLAYTMPLWAVVFGATFLGERLNLRRVIALALGMAGIAVLLSADLEELGIAPMGLVFIAASAISWAAGTVFLKRHQWTISVLSLTTWLVIVGTVPMIPIAVLIEGDPFPDASFQAYLAVAYSAVFAFVFAYYAWFKVVSIFPVSMASIGTLMVPVVGVFSGALVLGESPGWREFSALALVTMAIALVLARSRPTPGRMYPDWSDRRAFKRQARHDEACSSHTDDRL